MRLKRVLKIILLPLGLVILSGCNRFGKQPQQEVEVVKTQEQIEIVKKGARQQLSFGKHTGGNGSQPLDLVGHYDEGTSLIIKSDDPGVSFKFVPQDGLCEQKDFPEVTSKNSVACKIKPIVGFDQESYTFGIEPKIDGKPVPVITYSLVVHCSGCQ